MGIKHRGVKRYILGFVAASTLLIGGCSLFQSKKNIVDWITIPKLGTKITYTETLTWFDGTTSETDYTYTLVDIIRTDQEISLHFINENSDPLYITADLANDVLLQGKRAEESAAAPLFVLATPIEEDASYEAGGNEYDITGVNNAYTFGGSVLRDVVELSVTVKEGSTRVAEQTVHWSKSLLLVDFLEESTDTTAYLQSFEITQTSFEKP